MGIRSSVGRGGVNRFEDVVFVQCLINMNMSRLTPLRRLVVDGRSGPVTISAIEAFQERMQRQGTLFPGRSTPLTPLAVVSDGSGQVSPAGNTLNQLQQGIPASVNSDTLRAMAPRAVPTSIKLYLPHFEPTLRQYQIDTPLRRAHFFAQVVHESGQFNHAEELASGAAYEGRADLGNTQPGDGKRFKGRGLIQLTGRSNYAAYGKAIGVQLTGNQRWFSLSMPARAVDVAGWFWKDRGLNAAADGDSVVNVTQIINGGTNGLADRREALFRTKFLFKVQ